VSLARLIVTTAGLKAQAGERTRVPSPSTGRCVFAGDCKYKRPGGTVPNADIYQMLAYLTALQLPVGLLIYAASENVPPDLVIEQATSGYT
jgi:hypothetical protein